MVCKPKALIAGWLTVSPQTPQLRYGHYGDRLPGRANIYNVLPLVKKTEQNKLKLAFFWSNFVLILCHYKSILCIIKTENFVFSSL